MSELENIQEEFKFIKAAFESGKVKKMSDLEKEKPTLISKLLGMNQGRYGAKLFKPHEFSPSEISRISIILDVDAGLIINLIKKGINCRRKEKDNRKLSKIKKTLITSS